MGLGKTAQAVAACHALWRAGKVRRGLIVVPASLKSQWHREWLAFSDAPVEVVTGAPDDRKAAYRTRRRGFLIVNYEQTFRYLDLMLGCNPGIVVLDEAQRIKNWATKTAACVKQLRPAYRLVLTGTPMENRLEELASIMDWIDDRAIEPKWRLVPWHSVYADGSREVTGARNLDTLRHRLSHCMVRRRRHEILTQLPPRTDTNVSVELTPAQREEHDALNQPIAVLVNKARKRPLTQAEFLRPMSLLTTRARRRTGRDDGADRSRRRARRGPWPAGARTGRDGLRRRRVSRRAGVATGRSGRRGKRAARRRKFGSCFPSWKSSPRSQVACASKRPPRLRRRWPRCSRAWLKCPERAAGPDQVLLLGDNHG